MSAQPFLDAVEHRRTFYALSDKPTISDKRISEIVHHAIKHVPSSFNSQSTRTLVLLGDEHKKLWDIVIDVMKGVVPAEQFAGTEQKLNSFKAGYGSVLFYEDQSSVKALQDAFPLYQDRFPQWSEHTSGMHQFVVWTALEQEGLGCSLQHYNPLIDRRIADTWGIHADWKLISQLVFGKPEGEAGKKTFKPLEERVKIFGAKE